MSLFNAAYQHWQGSRTGIWHRRWIIARNGLQACLRVKAVRIFASIAWLSCLVQVTVLSYMGQLLVPDSLIVRYIDLADPRVRSFARGLVTWLEQHPDVSVRTMYDLFLYFYSTRLAVLSFIIVGMTIPHLITRDLASRAMLIYSSKAITLGDYLLGKFATVFGLLCLTWLGPVAAAWFFSNLLSPDWHFFWHSRWALVHSVGYVLLCSIFLSVFGLGISALSGREKSTVALWYLIWLFGGALVPISLSTGKAWLKYFSCAYDLSQLSLGIFNFKDNLEVARQNLPFFDGAIKNLTRGAASDWFQPHLGGSVIGLVVMMILAGWIVGKRVKPE